MKHKIYFAGGLLMAITSAATAGPTAALPFDGVAQGYAVVEPITIHATNNLAGFQCDVLFDDARLACTNLPALVSGPAGVVVDGELVAPGRYRLLAYSPLGLALTNDVVCDVQFSALTNAASGQATLGSASTHFGDINAVNIAAGKVNPGLILLGTAFGFFPSGGRAQFLGASETNYVITASTNFASWTALSTNVATNSLTWIVDTNALALAHRFYRCDQTPQ